MASVADVLIKGEDEVRYPMWDSRLTRGGADVEGLMYWLLLAKVCGDEEVGKVARVPYSALTTSKCMWAIQKRSQDSEVVIFRTYLGFVKIMAPELCDCRYEFTGQDA